MYKTHFAQAQYNREKKYAVLTKLVSNNSERYITKEAVFPEGADHIESIFRNYELLSNSSHKFLLPKTVLKKDILWIEYIEGINIESQIERLLFEGNIEEANKLVSEVIEFLESFPVIEDNPYNYPKFVSQFDPKKVYKGKNDITCLKPGFYDINFDNIIKKNQKYYFVDFEWCFEYPLPKEYLLLRTIFYLSLKLKRRIHSMTSPEFKCYNFFYDTYVPVEWLNKIPHSAEKFQKMLDYEYTLLSSIFIHYPKLEKIKNNYKKFIKDTPYYSPGESIFSLINTIENDKKEIAQLKSSIHSNNITIDTLQKSVKSKDEVIENHYKHIEELREINSRYQTSSYKTLETIEKTKIAQLKSSIHSNNITIDTLQKSVKSKDEVIENHYKHIEELREINSRYQTSSYKTLETIEKTKIAQFRPLRIMIRKTLSLLLRIFTILKLV